MRPHPLHSALFAAAVLGLFTACSARGQSVALGARSRGRPDAPITLYEMSDFQCPYCRDFALTTMPVLEREYIATGKVRFIYINMPLAQHAHAEEAAEVALCAARQNKFWPVHDALFRRQEQWANMKDARSYLLALADSAGTNPQAMAQCVGTPAARAAVEADAAAARQAGARSTPTFYVEGGLIEGAAPASYFRQALDSIYQLKTSTTH